MAGRPFIIHPTPDYESHKPDEKVYEAMTGKKMPRKRPDTGAEFEKAIERAKREANRRSRPRSD